MTNFASLNIGQQIPILTFVVMEIAVSDEIKCKKYLTYKTIL